MEVSVICYSGYLYAEQPRSLVWQGNQLEIESVEEAWLEPDRRLFRVVTHDGRPFELCYNEATDRWFAIELI